VKTFVSKSREETIALGERIGAAAPSGAVIAFRGGLGAGKTTMSKGIAAGLAIDEEISSPTYTIIAEYPGRLLLRHMDAYRLRGDADFEEIGGPELLGATGTLCLVEWSEKLPDSIGAETAIVEIEIGPGGERRINLSGVWLEALVP
jgi:tRNA threonylcarbamoyladenosine biosynthesis protein TsaE